MRNLQATGLKGRPPKAGRSCPFHSKRGTVSAFTITEVLIAIILLSLLFYAAYKVISHARQETMKGFWLQECITSLRNGTRAITQALKKTSYPSTLTRTGAEEVVVSYKDYRTYDTSGRLRKIDVKSGTEFDLQAKPGLTTPSEGTTVVFRFPVCTPESDSEGYQAGKIVWTDLVLEPIENPNSVVPLGNLHLVEREDSYDTRALDKRAFDLTKKFDSTLPVVRDKLIIRDVESVDVSVLWVDEVRGIAVDKDGAVDRSVKKRYLISVRVDCTHPKDDRLRIGDQCSITSNIDVHESGGTLIIKVVSIADDLSSAQIKVGNNPPQAYGVGAVLGGVYRITKIQAYGVDCAPVGQGTKKTFIVSP